MLACLILRGELLRNPTSTYHDGNKTKKLKPCNVSPKSIENQNAICNSIVENVIKPYREKYKSVFVSGCLYECEEYMQIFNEYFPGNTVKFCKHGDTNQAHHMMLGIEHARDMHPYCSEYISLRMDYLMLRPVVIHTPPKVDKYTGFGWINTIFPAVDVFFVISSNTIPLFIDILRRKIHQLCIDTHSLQGELKQRNVYLYPIWGDYSNGATGISYKEYLNAYTHHEKRPFVNYMRGNT